MAGSQRSFYDKYWSESGAAFSGDRTGYAANFRKWMAQNLAGLEAGDEILEVGCGDASFTKDLAGYSNRVSAVDISPAQIAANRHKYPGIDFVVHDLTEPLPFAPDRFAAVWCSEVLEHLFDPLFALREIYRVLKPGGVALITVPYHGLLKNVGIALFKWDHHFDPEYPHIRFFTRRSLQKLCDKCGFVAVRWRTCGMSKPLRDLFIPTNLLLRARKPG